MNIGKKVEKVIADAGHIVTPEIQVLTERIEEMVLAEKSSDIEHVLAWLRKKQKEYPVRVEEANITGMQHWRINSETGSITHESGKFFSIIGVQVIGAFDREVLAWSQPMLKQAEIGISGVIRKVIQGVPHYLFYAKFEPGNMDRIQISPALQVSEGNLSRAHQGSNPRLVEYFQEEGRGRLLKSVTGVEDGGRFYMKINRAMIVEVGTNENVQITDDYVWLTRPQIQKLLLIDNVMNSLARNVCAIL
jgi:dTDP-4-dehydro-6-deoxy-alpha-D-glucopyranose 2,3-dehydratase